MGAEASRLAWLQAERAAHRSTRCRNAALQPADRHPLKGLEIKQYSIHPLELDVCFRCIRD